MKRIIFPVLFFSLLLAQTLGAQEETYTHTTFKDRRVINTQSVETLGKRRLDVRISHRFGDFAGDNGGWATLFGLENASDILIVADVTVPFSERRLDTEQGFNIPWGVGLEIETGGHVFQVNFTNATALMETDYIPYTTDNWAEGEFRLGFTISRIFNL